MAEAGFGPEEKEKQPVLRPSVAAIIFMRRRRQMLYALAYIGQQIFVTFDISVG
jgi:hypothetical protein